MNFKLVKLDDFSGEETSFYSPYIEEYGETLFEQFLRENLSSYRNEVMDILERMDGMAHDTGARPGFFKEKEGAPGDLVCALYDKPGSKLRLYCIRYGYSLIILGGGGPKSKAIRALQENPKLKDENYLMREISNAIYQRQLDREIRFSEDDLDFEGDLDFEIEI